MRNLSYILLLFIFVTSALQAQAQSETVFAYATKDSKQEPSGTGKNETYDVAIALTNPQLAGKQITAIEIPVTPSANVTNLSVWLTRQLKLELVDEKNTNIVDKRWTIDMPSAGSTTWLKVTLDEPYTIPDEGLYVGYSLTVTKTDRTEATLIPIIATMGSRDGSFYLHTSRSYLNWRDRSSSLNVTALTQVYIAGELYVNGATLGESPMAYVTAGCSETLSLPVHNVGLQPISQLSYTTSVDGNSLDKTITLDPPIKSVFAYFENVPFEIPAIDGRGVYDIDINITAVNGEPNDADGSTCIQAKALKYVPKHLAAVEEFTGTWCGWCPRGFVAMEKMSQMYPDFIGIAYHDSDPMAMHGGYPQIGSGNPRVAINRVLITDPYFANSKIDGFSLPQVWEDYCRGFVPVGISVDAALDNGKVIVNSQVEWIDEPLEAESTSYRVEFVLLADDLHSPDFAWAQKNYYNTEPWTEDMDFFCHADLYVFDLHFNDVAILNSGGKGVEGSINTTETEVPNQCQYVFDTTAAINEAGTLIPFDSQKLRVVAMLIADDGAYGHVINATKCLVEANQASVSTVNFDTDNSAPRYYDLQGRPIDANSHGYCIEVTSQGARQILK